MPEEMTSSAPASDAGSVDTSSSSEVTASAEPTEATSTTDSSTTNTEPEGDVKVVVNDNGERTMKFENAAAILGLNKQDAQQEQAQNNVANEPPAPPAPEPYKSMDEILLADTQGALDWSRVTPEQNTMINNFKQAAQQRQQAEAMRQQQMAQAQVAMQKQQAAMIANAGVQARQMALQQMGITEQDLADADFEVDGEQKKANFNQLVNNIHASLITQAVEKQVIDRHNFQVYQNSMQAVRNFGEMEKVKEPYFNEIDALAKTRKQQMPYEQAVKVHQAEQAIKTGNFGQQQLAVLEAYWNDCKKEVYAKHNNVSKIPTRTRTPKVEGAGLPNNDAPRGIDISKTSNMSQRDRDAVFTQMFKQQLFGH